MNILKGLIKKYFSSFAYFYSQLKYRVVLVLVLGLVVGVLDAFGLTMFLPLMQLANESGEATGQELGFLAFVINALTSIGVKLTLIVALIIMATFFILKGMTTYLSESYKIKVAQYYIATLRLKLTDLFVKYSFKKFVASDIGRIQNLFTAETNKVYIAYKAYSEGMQQIIMCIVYMAFVFMIDYSFAILVMTGGILTHFLYGKIFKQTKAESIALSEKNSLYHKGIIQYVGNFKYLKATGSIDSYSNVLRHDITTIEAANRRVAMLGALVMGIREPILIIVVCSVILIKIYLFNGHLSTILMSLILFYRALTQLMNFQTYYNSFMANYGAVSNVSSFEKELEADQEQDGEVEFEKFSSQLLLKDVKFGFNENDLILKNINLILQKNQSIAFVGESGSGKTTLVNILCGLLPVTKGNLSIDNQDIGNIKKESYQRRIGYIAQESVIFNDTIFNNVTFWAEPTEENKIRFQTAIKQASIDTFINELKEKEQTLLGNNGINLSGGQKQRISIARELYKDIDILILDEATSALDSETEKEIQNNIDDLKGKYTIIIIAHRLSTIRNVDKVYLLDKGEIIDSGSFEELTGTSDYFRRMVELQEISISQF